MWFILDPLGITLGVLTWGLLAFADWVVVRHVFLAWFNSPTPRISWLPLTDIGVFLCALYQLVILLSWYSHFTSATTDPGTVFSESPPENFEHKKMCNLCQAWKPPRAHHCKTCHRCIFRMDHHCPWVNNCVGLTNQKLFILFLGYTAMSAIYTLILLISCTVLWLWNQKSWADAAQPSSTALICSGIVAVECLAAILFVGDFLQEQVESIQMNSTLVETYQRTHGTPGTWSENFRQVFGNTWWKWPLPIVSCQRPDLIEPVLPDDLNQPYNYDGSDDGLGIAGGDSEGVVTQMDVDDDAIIPEVGRAPRSRQRYEAATD